MAGLCPKLHVRKVGHQRDTGQGAYHDHGSTVTSFPRMRVCRLTAVVHPDAQRCVRRNTPQNTDLSQWHAILEE